MVMMARSTIHNNCLNIIFITCLLMIAGPFSSPMLQLVEAHGYLSDPPMRSSAWRFGFATPTNYNDNSLTCGSFSLQYNSVNKGRCGECGDQWSLPRPRDNDEGGKYGLGVIVRNYTQGALVPFQVTLTAAHNGYFEFRLCADKKTKNELVTQDCLDKHLLTLIDGTTRSYKTKTAGVYNFLVQLPLDVTCQYCVIQWTYATDVGTGETYKNCADVSIV